MRYLFASVLLLFPTAAIAQCDPVKFLAADITNITLTDELKTAFLQVANKEQYDQASQGGKTSFGYGPYSGSLDYDQAKASARKEAELRQYKYDRQFYVRYLTQRLSPVGAESYSKCLEQDRNSPGLRLWFSRMEGSFYFIKGFWVGRDTEQGVGSLNGDPIAKGFEIIQLPSEWTKGQTYEILAQKSSDVDGVISIKVGKEQAAFVAVRDIPPVQMATSRVESAKLVDIASGGTHDRKSPWVLPQRDKSCVYPSKPGRALLLGSGNVADYKETAAPNTVRWEITTNTPEEFCITFHSSTGDKKVRNTISGRAAAFERYVVGN